MAAIEKCMDDMIRKGGISANDLTAIGIAVPAVVDPDRGLVVVAPNMALTGVDIGSLLTARFKTPIIIGNDGNFVRWAKRGSARPVMPTVPYISVSARASAAAWCNAASSGRRSRVGRRDRPHDHATRRPEMRLRRPRLF